MIRVLLNREGWKVCKDLVYRLYKEEGLGYASVRQENDAPRSIVVSGCVRQGRTRFGRWTSAPAPRRASEHYRRFK